MSRSCLRKLSLIHSKLFRVPTIRSSRSLHYARCSELFQPVSTTPSPKEDRDNMFSKSQRLLMETGLVWPAIAPGTFHLLPLFVRSLEKLIRLIDYEMQSFGCQKISMPSLMDSSIWKTTDRWNLMANDMIKFRDRSNRDCCLGPTHEEPVTALLTAAWHKPSYKKFPLRLYQITPKFRDEMKPKHGLLRSREFLMKDLYTFDISESAAREGYELVCEAYAKIFRTLQINCIRVAGSCGAMGGKESHEFSLPCETVGEDVVNICQQCKFAFNAELPKDSHNNCPKCSGKESLKSTKAIEVAHAFLLGDHYSKHFAAKYVDMNSISQHLQMGCFGIGVTRLIAASLEVQSTAEKLIWPIGIAPYTVCVISPKAGSKEALAVGNLAENICSQLTEIRHLSEEVILDDRDDMTIGRRMNDAVKVGYPVIVVVGKKATEETPKFEVIFSYDPSKNVELNQEDLMSFFTV